MIRKVKSYPFYVSSLKRYFVNIFKLHDFKNIGFYFMIDPNNDFGSVNFTSLYFLNFDKQKN